MTVSKTSRSVVIDCFFLLNFVFNNIIILVLAQFKDPLASHLRRFQCTPTHKFTHGSGHYAANG